MSLVAPMTLPTPMATPIPMADLGGAPAGAIFNQAIMAPPTGLGQLDLQTLHGMVLPQLPGKIANPTSLDLQRPLAPDLTFGLPQAQLNPGEVVVFQPQHLGHATANTYYPDTVVMSLPATNDGYETELSLYMNDSIPPSPAVGQHTMVQASYLPY
jgi:hypothetical protein